MEEWLVSTVVAMYSTVGAQTVVMMGELDIRAFDASVGFTRDQC